MACTLGRVTNGASNREWAKGGGDASRALLGSGIIAASSLPADILMPGGSPVGRPGSSAGIRRLNGGLAEAQKMFGELAAGGKDITPPGYPGKLVELPGGGKVGLRPVSSSADKSPSLDVNIPGISVKKIHFEP